MVWVTKEEIIEVFRLKWSKDMEDIDQKKLRAEYEKVIPTIKVFVLPNL